MWFNILPSYGIMVVACAIPPYAAWGLHKLFTGNGYRRALENRFERALYMRDEIVSGDPYKSLGLENIPDEVSAPKADL